MLYLSVAISVIVFLYLIGRVLLLMAKDFGRAEALREVAERNASIREKQTEEMLKEKTVEDVARSLESGKF